jgi:hypothetical protein
VSAQSRRTVYLDINHWYALGRAMAGRSDRPEHVTIFDRLREEVRAGYLALPLSAVTYMELTENPRDQMRQTAADVMLVLSRLVTIAPASKVVDEELAAGLHRRIGRPAFPIKVPKFGVGVGFAFGTPGRVKATGLTEERRSEIETRMGRTIADMELEANARFEYEVLATPRSLRDSIPGFEPIPSRQAATTELASLQVMIDNLYGPTEIAGRTMDAVVARQWSFDILDNYTRALQSAGFTMNTPLRDKEALTEFLMGLPTQRVAVMLKYHYAKQAATRWKVNHLRDIEALSVAIPYADAVVTDRDAWDVATQRARLDKEFGTPIFKSLIEMAEHLNLL